MTCSVELANRAVRDLELLYLEKNAVESQNTAKSARAIDKWALHSRVLYWLATMNGGERAWTIDEVPLDWFYRPGVKLDFRDFSDGHVVTAAEVAGRVGATGHELKPLDIVLMNTRAGAAYDTPAYIDSGCGFGREATLWLLERGVRVLGTDGWSWDAPFSFTRCRFLESRDPSIIWEGTRQVSISGTARLKSWRTSNRCQQPVSWSRVFPSRSRSRARPQGLRAPWRSYDSDYSFEPGVSSPTSTLRSR